MWPFGPSRLRGDLGERLRAYAREELPDRLGLPPAAGARAEVHAFAHGKRSKLRCVTLDGHPPVVLRALKQYDGTAEQVNALLTERGVPVPRLLFVDAKRATRRRFGFCVLAEARLDGEVIAEMAEDDRADALIAAADALARLHRIRHPHAGKPWVGKQWRIEEWAPRRCSRLLDRMALLPDGPDAAQRRALAAWFAERLAACRPETFPLVHGDLNTGNIVMTPDGGPHLLDLSWLAYSFAQFDLVVAEYWMNAYAPDRTGEFLDRYFAAEPGLTRGAYEATRNVFAAWTSLRMASSRARRAARLRDKGLPGWEALGREAGGLWAETQRLAPRSLRASP